MPKKKLALILGSGFSAAAGLPTTNDLNKYFIDPRSMQGYQDGLSYNDENLITDVLKHFWRVVFGWEEGKLVPTLEEHFTQIDLAANSGHHLGVNYPPKLLRAIRRISIHRVFQLLDAGSGDSEVIENVLAMAFENFETSVVTLNWDIVVERALFVVNSGLSASGQRELMPDYTVVDTLANLDVICTSLNEEVCAHSFPLLRMHGAANWMYCDSCRRIVADLDVKSALQNRAYLEEADFSLFDKVHGYDPDVHDPTTIQYDASLPARLCSCGNRLAGRLATFSYRKAFSIYQFQVIWKRAFEVLRDADSWLLFGYSLPTPDCPRVRCSHL